MPAIGAYSVFSVRGRIPMAGGMTAELQRPGVPGYDVHDVGWGGEIAPIHSIAHYSSNALRETARIGINALKGSTITVTDDQGTAWTNLLVKDVKEIYVNDAITSTPSGNEFRLDLLIELRPLALTY